MLSASGIRTLCTQCITIDETMWLVHASHMGYPHEADLRWLLDGSYAAAIGERSAHASLVARLEGSTGGEPGAQTAAEESMIEAVAKGRPIREILARCKKKHQRVLIAYYRPDHLSTYWRELTHVLSLTGKYKRKEHGPLDGGIGLRVAVRSATPEQLETATMLRRAAELLASEAHAAYAALAELYPKERQRWFRSERGES